MLLYEYLSLKLLLRILIEIDCTIVAEKVIINHKVFVYLKLLMYQLNKPCMTIDAQEAFAVVIGSETYSNIVSCQRIITSGNFNRKLTILQHIRSASKIQTTTGTNKQTTTIANIVWKQMATSI